MTRPPFTLAEPTASFLDALSGADGTAAPALHSEIVPSFADATADQFRGQEITVHAPRLPEVRIEAPAVEDWFDADLLSGVATARAGLSGGGAGGSGGRAEAARRAAAARRDAAVASRIETSQGRPGLAPPPPPGGAPVHLAPTGHGQMPPAYVDPYAHPAPPRQAPAGRPQPNTAGRPQPNPVNWTRPNPAGRPQPNPVDWPWALSGRPAPRARPPAPGHVGYAPATRQRFVPPGGPGRPAGAPAGKTSYSFQPRPRRKRGGGWAALLAVILFLLISGTGRELLDVITDLLNR